MITCFLIMMMLALVMWRYLGKWHKRTASKVEQVMGDPETYYVAVSPRGAGVAFAVACLSGLAALFTYILRSGAP